jgi:hypothetical protein
VHAPDERATTDCPCARASCFYRLDRLRQRIIRYCNETPIIGGNGAGHNMDDIANALYQWSDEEEVLCVDPLPERPARTKPDDRLIPATEG